MAQQPLESIWTSRIDQRPGQLGAIIFAALISAGCGGSDTSGSSGQSGTQSYSVGGAISGLVGSGLVLSNNASDTVAVSANGAFTFASSLAAAGTYSVTIVSQPVNPSQTCSVGNG